MKIYVRKDLNMRKGKLSAQVSHAFMGLWLSLMRKEDKKYIFENENLEFYKKNKEENFPLEIIEVNSEEELLSYQDKGTTMIIKDQGRTEFKTPTYTCLALVEKNLKTYPNIKPEDREIVPIKQVLIANRDKGLNKLVLAPFAAKSSWEVIAEQMNYQSNKLILNLEDKEELYLWLKGAFAKITLKASEEELQELIVELSNSNINCFIESGLEEFNILGIEPKKIEEIDKFTAKFKLY